MNERRSLPRPARRRARGWQELARNRTEKTADHQFTGSPNETVVIAFVRQTNIAAGSQQINNAPPPGATSRVREIENQQIRLLEASNGERLDT